MGVLLASPAAAAPDGEGWSGTQVPDQAFPGAGRVAAFAGSGLPFLALGEMTVGLSDRFAVGAVAGATPDRGPQHGTLGVGVRPRMVLFAEGPWRSTVVLPILYYPEVKGFGDTDPWVLLHPELTFERRLPAGVTVSAGLGLIGTACTHSILTLGREHTMDGGIWDTVALGGSIPLSRRTSFVSDLTLILSGARVATNWPGGPPVVGWLGVATLL